MFQTIIGLFLLIIAIFILAPNKNQTKPELKLRIGRKTEISVILLKTDVDKSKGYSNHKPIGFTEGLLFVYDSPGIYPFWMKEMLFDLDFIFINKNKIVYLKENIKAPINNNDQINFINSPYSFDQALEVKQGFIKKYKIRINDEVKIQ